MVTMALAFLLALSMSALAAAGEPPAHAFPPQPVTVFFQFESPAPPQVFAYLRAELDRLFAPVPVRFDWLRIEEAPEAGVLGEAVVVRFRGNCSLNGLPPVADERGPYAWASVTGGVVQPFAAINCDRVRAAVHGAMWGGERGQADRFLGRALGRVAAHEVYHMYFRSRRHEGSGVMRHALSPMDLVAERSELHPEDRALAGKPVKRP